jgi:hypothetical protein
MPLVQRQLKSYVVNCVLNVYESLSSAYLVKVFYNWVRRSWYRVSVSVNCWWASPVESFLVLGSAGRMNIFSCLTTLRVVKLLTLDLNSCKWYSTSSLYHTAHILLLQYKYQLDNDVYGIIAAYTEKHTKHHVDKMQRIIRSTMWTKCR